jgi:hypothetical protein
MMKKVLIILVGLVFAVGGFAWSFLGVGERQADAAGNVAATEIAATEAQILASTVQIELFDNGRVEGDIRQIRTSRGFGTVVQFEGQRFILTHNHWSISAAELNRAEIRNGAGQTLLVLDGPAFYSLARYLDGGTLLLAAPAGLAGVNAAELGDASTLPISSTVWLATYDIERGQGIQIETAWVREVDGAAVPGRLMLEGQEMAVISGDSGGGVWANSKLIGNLWTIQVAEQTWGLGISLNRPTGSIVAGMQPLPGAVGLTAVDLMFDSAGDGGFERGMVE